MKSIDGVWECQHAHEIGQMSLGTVWVAQTETLRSNGRRSLSDRTVGLDLVTEVLTPQEAAELAQLLQTAAAFAAQ